ncbi:hypothetical protein BDN72DRAFT_880289 [Pluteus cervinus]|uniref:Uncharacterized protein n=1 Tax=Pluteus cervinus TaxID=181527 RepID=A0ACD3ALP5_9AGAR|nr:hypothetical protein BDN72DRAFT_880289 [Pluteus cervinus]
MSSATEIPSAEALERVSELEVDNSKGEKVKFGSLYTEQKVVVVFIRHFFCGACQAYVEKLATVATSDLEATNTKLVIVGCGEWSAIQYYKTGDRGKLFPRHQEAGAVGYCNYTWQSKSLPVDHPFKPLVGFRHPADSWCSGEEDLAMGKIVDSLGLLQIQKHKIHPDLLDGSTTLYPNEKDEYPTDPNSYQFPPGCSSARYTSLFHPSVLGIEQALTRVGGDIRPQDCFGHYRDTDHDKDLYFLIEYYTDDTPSPRDRHWSLRWQVWNPSNGARALRCLEVVSSISKDFLVNWGPYSSTLHVAETGARRLWLKLPSKYSLGERRKWEQIAWNVGAIQPNGDWNCQNWLAAVFAVAVTWGLLEGDFVVGLVNRVLEGDHTSMTGRTRCWSLRVYQIAFRLCRKIGMGEPKPGSRRVA